MDVDHDGVGGDHEVEAAPSLTDYHPELTAT